MTHTNEDLIRERAHAIWLAEGCPEGCEDLHWRQAESELSGSADMPPPDGGSDEAQVGQGKAPTTKVPLAKLADRVVQD